MARQSCPARKQWAAWGERGVSEPQGAWRHTWTTQNSCGLWQQMTTAPGHSDQGAALGQASAVSHTGPSHPGTSQKGAWGLPGANRQLCAGSSPPAPTSFLPAPWHPEPRLRLWQEGRLFLSSPGALTAGPWVGVHLETPSPRMVRGLCCPQTSATKTLNTWGPAPPSFLPWPHNTGRAVCPSAPWGSARPPWCVVWETAVSGAHDAVVSPPRTLLSAAGREPGSPCSRCEAGGRADGGGLHPSLPL